MKKMTLADARAAAFQEALGLIDDMRLADAGKMGPKHTGQRGMDRSEALADAYKVIRERAGRPAPAGGAGAVPVSEWPKKNDEPVLIYVVHDSARLEPDLAVRRAKWEGWFSAYWSDFNGGGWIWHGMIGAVTHVAPQPARPELAP